MLQDKPEKLQRRQDSSFRCLSLSVFILECHRIIACVDDVFIGQYAPIKIA